MTLTPGTRIGPYEVTGPLGAGGMGEVYRASDPRLKREVAIKVLPRAFTCDPERLARFEREARMLATLNHPNIGAILGLEESDGTRALVLELVEGPTLGERIARGALPVGEALPIARQIAEALDAAHEKGMVHRDLKPANIKITPAGVVKVLDFGLAKMTPGVNSGDPLAPTPPPTVSIGDTSEGVIIGTAAYMSPEQARGLAVDKRTDIWAFGCVLFEMLTGQRAFGGRTFSDALVTILEREPDWASVPPATPAGVRHLLRRCLEKDHRQRLRDIADARFDLTGAEHDLGRTAPSTEVAPPPSGRGWSLLGSALIAGAGAVAGALVVVAVSGLRPGSVAAPAFDHFRRLVATPANEFGPALSPDGKWVAYVSDARGPTDVWVKFVAGGDPVNLTATSGLEVQSQDGISGLDISPDGTQISFIASRPGLALQTSWAIPAPLGGVPRPLLKGGDSGLHWSPDGRQVAFTRAGASAGDALGVADADGQNEREVVPRQNGQHVHWVRWSPDGQYLYFNYGIHNFSTEPAQVYRVPASGGPIEAVVRTTRRAMFPFPSADGRGLYYAANPDGGGLALWWRDFRTGRDHALTSGVAEYGAPSVSSDGQQLVATLVDVRRGLFRVPVRFDRPVALEPVTLDFTDDLDPSPSPDGSRLVISSSRDGARHIWSIGEDLSQPTVLTSGTAFDERPVFSPDGQSVAFISDRGGRRGIWLVGVEGGAARQVLQADLLDAISWSPDGREIVYATPGAEAPGLLIVTIADGRSRRLPTPGAASAPAWSPRGDVIAYVAPAPGRSRLRFVGSDGQPRHPEVPDVPDHFGNGFVSWSRDGRRLAVAGLPGARAGYIWIFEPGGPMPPRKLLDLPTSVLLRGMAWSRDGSSLIVGRVDRTSDIVLAQRSESPPAR